MAASSTQFARTLFFLFLFHFLRGLNSATFTIVNKCSYPVWPGILSGRQRRNGATPHDRLRPATRRVRRCRRAHRLVRPHMGPNPMLHGLLREILLRHRGLLLLHRGMRRWRRHTPGDTRGVYIEWCGGAGFLRRQPGRQLQPPNGGGGNCTATGCVADLNGGCPWELKVKMAAEGERGGEKGVACKSACEAFGDPRYCCSGAYGTPQTCKPSSYSQFFKSACPRAYSYAYDDGSSTFTCASANYLITFCPTPSSKSSIKSGNGKVPVAVDFWVGQAQADTGSAKVMAVALGAVLLTIWWQLNSIS